MSKEYKDFNLSFKEYKNNSKIKNEWKSVENFLKKKFMTKKYEKQKKGKTVNFIDELDKNKKVAEIINIQAFKEWNIINDDEEEDENILTTEATNEVYNQNCTCSIY